MGGAPAGGHVPGQHCRPLAMPAPPVCVQGMAGQGTVNWIDNDTASMQGYQQVVEESVPLIAQCVGGQEPWHDENSTG
jgi:hypothetical protein